MESTLAHHPGWPSPTSQGTQLKILLSGLMELHSIWEIGRCASTKHILDNMMGGKAFGA